MVRKISLGLSVLVLVMFLLPWVAVTCAGEEVMTATGLEMVTGFDYETPGGAEEASPEVLAIAILAIGLIGAGAYFLRDKTGAMSRGIFATLGIIFLLALKFKIDGNIEKEGQGMFQASYLPGFWIASLSFITVAILNFLNFAGLRRVRVETHSEGLSPAGAQTPEAAQENVPLEMTKVQSEPIRSAAIAPPLSGTRLSDRVPEPALPIDEVTLNRNRLIAVAIGLIVLAIFYGVAFRLPEASTHIVGGLFVGSVIKIVIAGILLGLLLSVRSRLASVITYYAHWLMKVKQDPSRAKVAGKIEGLSAELSNIVIIVIAWPLVAQIVKRLVMIDREMNFGWILILVTIAFVGLLLYRLYKGYQLLEPILAVVGKGRQEIQEVSCPKCKTTNSVNAKFCASCGTELQPMPVEEAKPISLQCPKCGAENSPDAKFCQSCGASLSKDVKKRTGRSGGRNWGS